MATIEVTNKLCLGCRTYLPLSAFRRRGDGRLHSRCKSCFAEYMRRYRHARKLGFVRRFCSAVARAGTDSQIEAFTAVAIHRLGGIARLSKAFVEHFGSCPAGGRARTTIHIAILRLIIATGQERDRQAALAVQYEREEREREEQLTGLMTKEELEADLDRFVRRRVHELAAGMGMKLVPINDPA